jgi:hypothetical protein
MMALLGGMIILEVPVAPAAIVLVAALVYTVVMVQHTAVQVVCRIATLLWSVERMHSRQAKHPHSKHAVVSLPL